MSRGDQVTLSTVWERYPEALIEIKQKHEPLLHVSVTIRPVAGPTTTGAALTVSKALEAALGASPKRGGGRKPKGEATPTPIVVPVTPDSLPPRGSEVPGNDDDDWPTDGPDEGGSE